MISVPPLTCPVVFTPAEANTLTAILERLFPADENGPGATEIGVLDYLDRALSGPYCGNAGHLSARLIRH